jgi:hypothetical protein
MTFRVPEKFRVHEGQMASDSRFGNNGAFMLKLAHAQTLFAIASDQWGWEHVSVSRRDRCPTWDEMCQVKAMFWDAEDCVVQYHPPESEYVNQHPNCLHLWRKIDQPYPLPPSIMVGFK